VLALARIIVVKQVGSANVPASFESVAQFQPDTRVACDVKNISRPHTMLRNQPELSANMSVSHWGAPWLSGFATDGFEKGVTWWRETRCKQQPNWRVEHVFL
jgi:hypothetical protein